MKKGGDDEVHKNAVPSTAALREPVRAAPLPHSLRLPFRRPVKKKKRCAARVTIINYGPFQQKKKQSSSQPGGPFAPRDAISFVEGRGLRMDYEELMEGASASASSCSWELGAGSWEPLGAGSRSSWSWSCGAGVWGVQVQAKSKADSTVT
jgi:hypothetical protein